MSSPKEERVRDVVAPVVRDAGLHLEEVTVHPAGRRTLVRVTVDLEEDELGAVDLDRIAEVSRAVAEALDAADVLRTEHVLEVSSPGTDRPLTAPRHFKRARGRVVTLWLADGSTTGGRVTAADDEAVELDSARTVRLAEVVRGKVEVELNRLEEIELDDDEEA